MFILQTVGADEMPKKGHGIKMEQGKGGDPKLLTRENWLNRNKKGLREEGLKDRKLEKEYIFITSAGKC